MILQLQIQAPKRSYILNKYIKEITVKNNIKKISIFLSLSLAIVFSVVLFTNTEDATINETDNDEVQLSISEIPAGTRVDAIYADMEKEIDKLLKKSELIISGTVSDRNVGKLSTEYLVEVNDLIKGKKIEHVKVIVLNSGNSLEIGTEYILALKKQDVADEQLYYVAGGEQGIFYYENGEISNSDNDMQLELQSKFYAKDKKAKKDFKEFIKENLK